MRAYIIRKLLLAIPTTFLVTVIIFLIVRLVPGDAVDALAVQLAAQGVNVKMVREDVERMLGLDVPVLLQRQSILLNVAIVVKDSGGLRIIQD